MEDKEINIPEINFEELDLILDKGVKEKISFITYLKKSFKEIGVNNIFPYKIELSILAIISLVLLILTYYNSLDYLNIEEAYKFTFLISPILYLITILLYFYISKERGTLELEMTCKYNLYQLSALRMFIFSLGSIFLNTISIGIVYLMGKEIDLIRFVVITITGVFLFSIIFLYSILKIKRKVLKLLALGTWILINLYFNFSKNYIYKEFLMEVPIIIHIIISIFLIVLYVKNLTNLINYKRKRERI